MPSVTRRGRLQSNAQPAAGMLRGAASSIGDVVSSVGDMASRLWGTGHIFSQKFYNRLRDVPYQTHDGKRIVLYRNAEAFTTTMGYIKGASPRLAVTSAMALRRRQHGVWVVVNPDPWILLRGHLLKKATPWR
jgi:hypothetical protein